MVGVVSVCYPVTPPLVVGYVERYCVKLNAIIISGYEFLIDIFLVFCCSKTVSCVIFSSCPITN